MYYQGDIYSASYAAVPVIISLIEQSPEKVCHDYFLLPTCIEIARLKGNGSTIGEDIKADYIDAIYRMGDLTDKVKSTNGVKKAKYW